MTTEYVIKKIDSSAVIKPAQLEQLLSIYGPTTATTSIVAMIVAYTMQEVVNNQTIAIWLIAALMTALIRYILLRNYKKYPAQTEQAIHHRLISLRTAALFSALIWSLCGIFLFPAENLNYQIIIVVALAGLSAGGISYSVDKMTAMGFAILPLMPIIIRMLISKNTIDITIGLATGFCVFFLVILISRIHQYLTDNILLQHAAMMREKQSALAEEHYRLVLNHSPVGIAHYDSNFNITYCNKSLADILHTSIDQVVQKKLTALKDQSIAHILDKALLGKIGHYEGEFTWEIGHVSVWVNLTTAPYRDISGKVVGGVAIIQDITHQKKVLEEIKQLAFYDVLTGLPNRRLLFDRLKRAISLNTRSEKNGALLFLDLDKFKSLNDSFGHDMGDLLLKQVAERLTQCVRETDTVARIGGDEFIVMLEDLNRNPKEAHQQVEIISNKIATALSQAYQLGQYEYFNKASIGIAMFGQHGETMDELLKNADIAMYEAKKSGKNIIKLFDYKMRNFSA